MACPALLVNDSVHTFIFIEIIYRWDRFSCTKEGFELKSKKPFKRTVARSHRNARRASRARRTRHVNTPRVRRAFVENFSDASRAQDNLSKVHIFGKGVGARQRAR